MNVEELNMIISSGEKVNVEFKLCQNEISKTVYETVCSFNNRNGGHILLGINDKKEVIGVDPTNIDKIIKDFTTTINNGTKIYPPLYITPEIIPLKNRNIIYIWVPKGAQIRRLNGKIWDRSFEGDIDITNSSELVYKIYASKQHTYFVNRIFHGVGIEALDVDTIRRAQKLAITRVVGHPWETMTAEEILRSSGLLLTDFETQQEGITIAAILLFGKTTSILSILPQFKTDAIYRVKNLDRYDDRDVVICNLIDSFDRLIAFGKKHLNDLFVMEGIQSISARDKILREIISNCLAHRDFSSGFPAKFIIENDKIYTENANMPHLQGELQLETFEPFPKNPPISKIFREIGFADELGSGMRNTYKYTKLYSQEKPIFAESDIFRTSVPLYENSLITMEMSDILPEMSDILPEVSDILLEMSDILPEVSDILPEVSDKLQDFCELVFVHLKTLEFVTTGTLISESNLSPAAIRRNLNKLCELGILRAEGKNKGKKYYSDVKSSILN